MLTQPLCNASTLYAYDSKRTREASGSCTFSFLPATLQAMSVDLYTREKLEVVAACTMLRYASGLLLHAPANTVAVGKKQIKTSAAVSNAQAHGSNVSGGGVGGCRRAADLGKEDERLLQRLISNPRSLVGATSDPLIPLPLSVSSRHCRPLVSATFPAGSTQSCV